MALPFSFTLLSLQLPNTDVSIIPTGSVTSMFYLSESTYKKCLREE